MAQSTSNSGGQRSSIPLKPLVQTGNLAGSAPFKPPSSGRTVDIVETSGHANAGEIVPAAIGTATNNSFGRSVPPRPWNSNNGRTYGGYRSWNYNSHGGYSGSSLNNRMHNRFGGPLRFSYGGGYYNGVYGGSRGPYGTGMIRPNNNQVPNNTSGPTALPPGFWMSVLRTVHGAVNCFGRISMLVDQSTHAFHIFLSSLLELFDSSGLLYSELARFVLRILRIRMKPNQQQQQLQNEAKNLVAGPNVANGWDNLWAEGRN